MHTRQWVGTYAGKGNGDYRGELACALRAITAYLKHFAFPPEMALVRLDGAYGDATVIAQLLLAGVYSVPRWRGYQLLERPQIQLVLAHPLTASMTRMNSGEVVELFDGGWLEPCRDLSHVRVIVVRHPAPPPGKDIPVGKHVGEWVYELFITTLGADGFLVEDVLDLYHGRGAFEAVLADEDYEEVMALHSEGLGQRAIARQLRISRNTVQRYVASPDFPERAEGSGRLAKGASKLDRYLPNLREQWNAGSHNCSRLFDEVKERGYTGCQSGLRKRLAEWRAELPPRRWRGNPPKPRLFAQKGQRRLSVLHLIAAF